MIIRGRRRLDGATKRARTLETEWHRHPVMVKRRTAFGRLVAAASNLYFRLAGLPIWMCDHNRCWQRWEVACFRLLNPGFRAFALGRRTICIAKLPGESLWAHLRRGTLSHRMIKAAAREFRRAHMLHCDALAGPWSHGDACTENVLYDHATDRARFIDFEFLHDKTLPPETRHADDLLIFALDLMSISPGDRWLPLTLTFLRTYGDPSVIAELRKRLSPPRGAQRIWWRVRTRFVRPQTVNRFLHQLAQAIDQGVLTGPEPAELPEPPSPRRQRRRHSATFHTINPGTPNASSRTRRIKASAIAVPGSIPSSRPTTR
jgi:hypothetical protein